MGGHNRVRSASSVVKHVAKISDLDVESVHALVRCAADMKEDRALHAGALAHKTLLMLFEKPSLRTRVSFETGMFHLGGHAINYKLSDSPLGDNENIHDTSLVLSRYVDCILARVRSRSTIMALCNTGSLPVINALDDWAHPSQILADLLTMQQHFGDFKGLKLAFVGDTNNNMTYDLMRAACMVGMTMTVAGPPGSDFAIAPEVLRECELLSAKHGGCVTVCRTAEEAVKGVHAVYADSWMSYHVDPMKKDERRRALLPFQVTSVLMQHAAPNAVFLNCLPAIRGEEQTAEVIDGPQSIVFDQAENRLHTAKALLLHAMRPDLVFK